MLELLIIVIKDTDKGIGRVPENASLHDKISGVP